jgi:hypothetical protein
MMAAYRSAKEGRRVRFDPASLRGYRPPVASGEWDPRDLLEAG